MKAEWICQHWGSLLAPHPPRLLAPRVVLAPPPVYLAGHSEASGWLTYGKQIDIASDVKSVLQFVEARRSSVAMVHAAKEAVKIVQAV